MSQVATPRARRARRLAPVPSSAPTENGHSRGRPLGLGAAPLLALAAAGGLVLVALGNNAARESAAQAQPLFWCGLVVIYAPIALRMLSTSASREERIALSLLLGGALFLVKVLYNPLGFTLHDELSTWRQVSDLLQSGHPLSSNPLVTGYAGFPGLELFTAATADLTGLSLFASGVLVIGVGRLALMLALFLFLERVTLSPRAAGVGIAVYACNPSFLYFDSQFAYESLALLVGAALLLASLRWTDLDRAKRPWNVRGQLVAIAILACTLAVTHHMTSYAVFGFLVLWALVIAFSSRVPGLTIPGAGPPAGWDRGSTGRRFRPSSCCWPPRPGSHSSPATSPPPSLAESSAKRSNPSAT